MSCSCNDAFSDHDDCAIEILSKSSFLKDFSYSVSNGVFVPKSKLVLAPMSETEYLALDVRCKDPKVGDAVIV